MNLLTSGAGASKMGTLSHWYGLLCLYMQPVKELFKNISFAVNTNSPFTSTFQSCAPTIKGPPWKRESKKMLWELGLWGFSTQKSWLKPNNLFLGLYMLARILRWPMEDDQWEKSEGENFCVWRLSCPLCLFSVQKFNALVHVYSSLLQSSAYFDESMQ